MYFNRKKAFSPFAGKAENLANSLDCINLILEAQASESNFIKVVISPLVLCYLLDICSPTEGRIWQHSCFEKCWNNVYSNAHNHSYSSSDPADCLRIKRWGEKHANDAPPTEQIAHFMYVPRKFSACMVQYTLCLTNIPVPYISAARRILPHIWWREYDCFIPVCRRTLVFQRI